MIWKRVIDRKHKKVINLNFAKEILVVPAIRKPYMPKDAKPFAVVAVMQQIQIRNLKILIIYALALKKIVERITTTC